MITEDLESVKNFLKKNICVMSSLRIDDNQLRQQRQLQHLFFNKFSNKNKQKIYEIFLTYAEKAERAYPGAGIELLKKYLGISSDIQEEKSLNLYDLKKLILDMKFTEYSQNILLESLIYCKPSSKINIKRSINDKSYIEISNSYSFKVDSLIQTKIHCALTSKIILIDGFIENVSEIHHLLEYFSLEEKTTPFLIFCRGMSDDVCHTIATNNLRGTFLCFPYKVNFDLENANTLVDIAVITGSDIISTLKGDLISSIKIDSLKTVDSFIKTSSEILIKNSKYRQQVNNHINQLKFKAENSNEDIKKYLFERIKSLTSNSIDIVIPDDINFYFRSQELDSGIRLIISQINNSPSLKLVVDEYYQNLISTLNSISFVI